MLSQMLKSVFAYYLHSTTKIIKIVLRIYYISVKVLLLVPILVYNFYVIKEVLI